VTGDAKGETNAVVASDHDGEVGSMEFLIANALRNKAGDESADEIFAAALHVLY
jgi:hypothetical protein